jgi:Ca2+-binding EF-hand superfamily protein
MHFSFYGWLCSCVRVQSEEFDVVDDDHDGRISLNEFHSYFMKKYGRPPTNDQWFKFHLADKNNNGYISKYDVEMFEKQNKLFN